VPPDPRERLAAEQAALVRALVAAGPVPDGFDPGRVRATSAALARKRAREVARAWPALALGLGDRFEARLEAWAGGSAPPPGGALADGLAFARARARRGGLSADARVERALVEARWRLRHGRLVPRRGLTVRAAVGEVPHRLVVVAHIPVLGERRWSLPLTGRER